MSDAPPRPRPGSTAERRGGADRSAGTDATDRTGIAGGLRRPALLGVVLLLGSYLRVIYHVTDVVGGTAALAALIAGTALAATVTARFVRPRTAVALGALLLGGGLAAYFFAVPEVQRQLFTVERVLSDTAALLTGLSVLRLTQAKIWALAVAPGPLFLSWYFAVRGRIDAAVTVGGAALLFFVLTGDADTVVTLVGVVGAALAIGLDTLDARGGVAAQWDTLALVIALMIVGSVTLSVVPGDSGGSVFDDGRPTTQANLVSSSDRVDVVGSIRLSPKVRFVVETERGREAYWRTASYDRYTGGGWVRSGQTREYRGRLDDPPGESQTVEQRVTAKAKMNALPAAWKPVALDGRIERTTRVTEAGDIRTTSALRPGDRYAVRSEVPQYTPAQLRDAGDDYPAGVRERYLQLPSSTPDRVGERATEIRRNAGADGAYETAKAFESYLEREKEYSLDVGQPRGDIADSFLFEMEAGYCTYYATTMVTMLRTQGIPARFVTGYTPGERVSEEKWVVRGLNAHAWVEVYFPGVGWVQFDPTPSAPREVAEEGRVSAARSNGTDGVDAAGSSAPGEWTPEPTGERPTNEGTVNGPSGSADGGQLGPTDGGGTDTPAANGTTAPSGASGGSAGGGTSEGGIELPSPTREELALAAAVLVALAAGISRFGVARRGYRALWLRYQGGRRDPEADVERAFERLEYLLGRRHRPRRPGETPRAYLAAVGAAESAGAGDADADAGGSGGGGGGAPDERIAAVGRAYERARYGGGVSREEADAAVAAVDSLVRGRTPVLGWFRRR